MADSTSQNGFKIRGLRWVIIGLVFFATLINYIDRLTISVLAPLITKELNLSNTEFGGIATWFLFAYTLSQALSGKLYDRIGIKKGVTVSIVVWSLAAMAHAFAVGIRSLSAFRFVLGLGEAGNWPGAAKTVAGEVGFVSAPVGRGVALTVDEKVVLASDVLYGVRKPFTLAALVRPTHERTVRLFEEGSAFQA